MAGIVVSPELDPIPLAVLDPIADLCSIERGILRVNTYALDLDKRQLDYWRAEANRRTYSFGIEAPPSDAVLKGRVMVILLERDRAGFGVGPPTARAQTMGEELNLLKLATLPSGMYSGILDVKYGGFGALSGTVLDRRPFKDLRLAVYNAERAFRVLESYPWPGDRGIFNSAWREFHFAGLRSIVHGEDLLTQDGIRTYVTLSALSRWNELVDRVNAKVEKKVRRAQRVATFQMIAFTAAGLGFGAALGAGAGAFAKFVLGRATAAQQTQLAGDLKDLAQDFQGEQPEFAAEIRRTAAALALEAAAVAPASASEGAPSTAAVTLPPADPGSVQTGSVTSPPAAVASSRAAAPGNILENLLDAIAGAIRRILGR